MLFSFVCCLSVLVVTWKTSCGTSTSSHYGNYSAKAPAIESFPACSFCTSQGNSKSQCHLLKTFKCGPSSRLHDRWGDPPHVTPPPYKQAPSVLVKIVEYWPSCCFVLFFVFAFFFLSSGSIKTQKERCSHLDQTGLVYQGLIMWPKREFFYWGTNSGNVEPAQSASQLVHGFLFIFPFADSAV